MKGLKGIIRGMSTAAALMLCLAGCAKKEEDAVVKVGILHSLSGPMAHSEVPVYEMERMAVDEINEAGGVLGRRIEIVVRDGESNPQRFGEQARALLTEDNVAAIFGCWTSAARKEVRSVVENDEIFGLLWYPLQYEGLEASPNIMYVGAAPNQQVVPAVEYCFQRLGSRMFLLGSDYVFPHTANSIIKALITFLNGETVGERYVDMECGDFSDVIAQIQEAKPDVILNTLNGDSNKAFFTQLKEAGITADDIPVMSFSVAEEEVRFIGPEYLVGHYVVWSYFQSISSMQNLAFVSRYKNLFGKDAVIGDPMEAGYIAVYLWAAACEKAGSFDVEDVRMAAKGLSFEAPEGTVTIDGENQHLKKRIRVGQINENGLIDEVWRSPTVVKPDPYLSTYAWAKGQ